MNKLSVTLLIIGSFIVGGAVSGYAVYKLQPNDDVAVSDQKDNTDNDKTESVPTPPADEISGYGLTPPQMADELLLVPEGEQFDWRYMNYLQELRLNEIAMSRIAAEKATKPELKAMATEQQKLSTDLNDKLSAWRNLWGFTDH